MNPTPAQAPAFPNWLNPGTSLQKPENEQPKEIHETPTKQANAQVTATHSPETKQTASQQQPSHPKQKHLKQKQTRARGERGVVALGNLSKTTEEAVKDTLKCQALLIDVIQTEMDARNTIAQVQALDIVSGGCQYFAHSTEGPGGVVHEEEAWGITVVENGAGDKQLVINIDPYEPVLDIAQLAPYRQRSKKSKKNPDDTHQLRHLVTKLVKKKTELFKNLRTAKYRLKLALQDSGVPADAFQAQGDPAQAAWSSTLSREPQAEPPTEPRQPATVTDQGPAAGAGGERKQQNEALFAAALGRLRHQHGEKDDLSLGLLDETCAHPTDSRPRMSPHQPVPIGQSPSASSSTPGHASAKGKASNKPGAVGSLGLVIGV
jgi:hypothetical protein